MEVLICDVNTSNIPALNKCRATYGPINGAWILPRDWAGETFADALLEATWTDLINATEADRMFILPSADDFEKQKEDANFKTGNLTKEIRTRQSLTTVVLTYHNLKDCLWSKIQTLDGQERQIIWVTENDALMSSANSTNILGGLYTIYVEEVDMPESKDETWSMMVTFKPKNDTGNITKALLPNKQTTNSWSPSNKVGITDVTITDNESVEDSLVVDIVADCDGAEITDLVTDDIVVTNSAGATITVTATNVGNTYTLAGTIPAETYTVTLANQPTMTTKGYENQVPVTIVIT